MRKESYSSCPVSVCLSVCVCVCVSVFSILPSRAFRRPTRGISSYSSNETKKPFALKLLSSKVRSSINLPRLSQPIFFTCNVSIYLSVTRTYKGNVCCCAEGLALQCLSFSLYVYDITVVLYLSRIWRTLDVV